MIHPKAAERIFRIATSLPPHELSLSDAINLVNGSTIGDAVSQGSRIKQIVEANKDDKKVVEELYFAILNRAPSEKELEGINLGEKRLENAQDIAWALLNSPAFLYNR